MLSILLILAAISTFTDCQSPAACNCFDCKVGSIWVFFIFLSDAGFWLVSLFICVMFVGILRNLGLPATAVVIFYCCFLVGHRWLMIVDCYVFIGDPIQVEDLLQIFYNTELCLNPDGGGRSLCRGLLCNGRHVWNSNHSGDWGMSLQVRERFCVFSKFVLNLKYTLRETFYV